MPNLVLHPLSSQRKKGRSRPLSNRMERENLFSTQSVYSSNRHMTYPTTPFNGAPSSQNGGGEQSQATPISNKGAADAAKSTRLLSLDLLRGMDLAFLVLFQPVVYQWLEACQPAAGTFGAAVYGQITHVPWQGFCFWDIIMPLFMFMSGITLPFSLAKYQRGESKAGVGFLLRLL